MHPFAVVCNHIHAQISRRCLAEVDGVEVELE
jgi:hypothetical protein